MWLGFLKINQNSKNSRCLFPLLMINDKMKFKIGGNERQKHISSEPTYPSWNGSFMFWTKQAYTDNLQLKTYNEDFFCCGFRDVWCQRCKSTGCQEINCKNVNIFVSLIMLCWYKFVITRTDNFLIVLNPQSSIEWQ